MEYPKKMPNDVSGLGVDALLGIKLSLRKEEVVGSKVLLKNTSFNYAYFILHVIFYINYL